MFQLIAKRLNHTFKRTSLFFRRNICLSACNSTGRDLRARSTSRRQEPCVMDRCTFCGDRGALDGLRKQQSSNGTGRGDFGKGMGISLTEPYQRRPYAI